MLSSARANLERLQALIATVREWVEQTVLWRIWERALENEFIDRSVALGAKAFVSLFPALLVVAAFMPDSVQQSIVTTLAKRGGISGDGLETVKGAFASSGSVRRATGVLGLLLTFFYINSFTGALRRVYTRAWRRPPGSKVSGYALGASWLLGIAIYLAIIGVVRSALAGGPEIALFGVFAWAAAIGLWWLTPWLMLQRAVRWRAMSMTGVLTGTALSFYAVSAAVWMPRVMESNQRQFGFFGVTLALVTWLTGGATIIVISACAGAVCAEDDGIIGRLVRGKSAAVLTEGAPASLAAPVRAPTLTSALGLGGREDREESGGLRAPVTTEGVEHHHRDDDVDE